MGRGSDSDSPAKGRGSSRRRSPVQRQRSPARRKSSPRTSRGRSPRNESTCSPSPRTKRLQRAQADMEVDRVGDREREGRRSSSSREGDKEMHKERGGDREGDKRRSMERGGDKEGDKERNRERGGDKDDPRNIRERRSRETGNGGNFRSKHKQSTSPLPNSEGEDHPDKLSFLLRDEGDISVTKMKAVEEALEKIILSPCCHQKPSFELSGKLAEETNREKGVTLLFTEPSDARIPDVRWRLYVFKGGEVLNDPLYIHRKTCYVFGRERRVADIPTDHPSCSKKHAVIQYRLVEKEQPDGMLKKKVSPYIMDLGSTKPNDDHIESQRYYELKLKDTIKFGNCSREYVVLHENSAH
ncbi:hypothetical protein MKW98_015577 [Papaver atlanticum]|uniref:FHA domain-containing protein n=1 Tax=Papaver atlanticum TaxID=357466 RepID=A0AAD4S4R9_9MAGN|nr:hypothetical protein MKW98_015577 [Papaver atlanticum]